MKKIFYSLLAVAALASCAKTEAVYLEDQAEIKIKPATALATKANVLAAIDGTEYPVAENFDVYAYWANLSAGNSFTNADADVTTYLGEGGAVEFTNKGLYWGGTTTYYWPKNGSLRFAAYSPSNVDMAHDLDSDTYTVEGYEHPTTTATTWDLLVAPTSPSYTAMTAAENVSVVFEHALSWITVKVVAKDAEAAKAFDIKKVTINDVNSVADLNAAMADGIQVEEWSNHNTPVGYVVYEGSQAVTETATVIETTPDGTVIIPQATTTITVDYTQNALEGTPALDNQQVTVDLVLDTNNTPWEPGKHYVYTLVFGLDEILINPDVVDWDDVEVGEIDTDKTAVNVSTADQLKAAIKENAKVVLQNDIELSEILTINVNNVVLDGNGYTLTSTAGRAINVDGDVVATIKNLNIDCSGERAINIINGAAKVTVDNVTATCTNYAIMVATSASNVSLGVSNSDLTGLNVVNVAGANAHVELYKTNLTCDDQSSVESYGAISFYATAVDSKVIVRECNIVVNGDSCAGAEAAYGATIEIDEKTTGNTEIQKFPFAVIYPESQNAYVCTTFAEALEVAEEGETITLTQDVTVDAQLNITKSIVLDLNGNTLTAAAEGKDVDAIWVRDNAEVVITGNGVVNATFDAVFATGNSKVTIENGTFIGAAEAVYAQANASVVINGGSFKSTEYPQFTLNLKDSARATASILVNAGSFYNFNPADNAAEGDHTNFVAAGKTVEQDGDWYIVK